VFNFNEHIYPIYSLNLH